jgi:flagellar motor protein MotB
METNNSDASSSAGGHDQTHRDPPVRRGSMKDRYDELVEERKKMDAEKVNKIKETRQSTGATAGSIKNKWEGAVAQHKHHEAKKFEETKESTMSGFRGTEHDLVKRLIKKFNRIFVQKKLKGDKFISRYAKMKEKATISTSDYLDIQNCPSLTAGVMQLIDLSVTTDPSLLGEIRKELAENPIMHPEVGLFSEGDTRPPIEVSSLICLSESGNLVMSLRMDVLPSHANDLKSYGHQKVIFYLPTSSASPSDPHGQDPTTEHHEMGPTILQFEFDLSPSVGWEEFHRRTERMNSFDPVDIMKTHNSFLIQPISVKKQAPPPPPPPPPPPRPPAVHTTAPNPSLESNLPDSPCGSEPILLHAESLETPTSDVSQQPTDDQPIQIILSDPNEQEEEDNEEDHDGYLILPPSSSSAALSAASATDALPMVTSYVPSILYHESHEHRLIPTSVLDPNLDLSSFSCVSCSRSAAALSNSPLLYVCPDCKSFLCADCSRTGNGVKGSIDTKQIELNAEILFKPGYSSLLPESYNLLNQIGKFLLDNPIPIRIEGHINAVQENGKLLDDSSKLLSVREPNCNGQMLSQMRAEKVSQYLQSLGISERLLKVEGCGGRKPLTREKKLLNKNRYSPLLLFYSSPLLCPF